MILFKNRILYFAVRKLKELKKIFINTNLLAKLYIKTTKFHNLAKIRISGETMKLNKILIFFLGFSIKNLTAMEQPIAKPEEETKLSLIQMPLDIHKNIISFLIEPSNPVKEIHTIIHKLSLVNKFFYGIINTLAFTEFLIPVISQKLKISSINAAIELLNKEAFNWLKRKMQIPEINTEISKMLIDAVSEQNSIGKIKFLLDLGVDANTIKNNTSSLSFAAFKGHTEIVKLLLEKGANIDEKTNKEGNLSLILAISQNHKEIVKLLLERGANVNATDVTGNTVLMNAASLGYIEIVELLLKYGADTKIVNREDGNTALKLASDSKQEKIVELLQSYKK